MRCVISGTNLGTDQGSAQGRGDGAKVREPRVLGKACAGKHVGLQARQRGAAACNGAARPAACRRRARGQQNGAQQWLARRMGYCVHRSRQRAPRAAHPLYGATAAARRPKGGPPLTPSARRLVPRRVALPRTLVSGQGHSTEQSNLRAVEWSAWGAGGLAARRGGGCLFSLLARRRPAGSPRCWVMRSMSRHVAAAAHQGTQEVLGQQAHAAHPHPPNKQAPQPQARARLTTAPRRCWSRRRC